MPATEVPDLLAQVRLRYPVVLLSNATDRLPGDLDRLGIAEAFDQIVNTADVGAPAAFEAAAAAVGTVLGHPVRSGLIAYVGGTAGHVTAAEAPGWRGHVFRDAMGLHSCAQLAREMA